MTTELIEHPVYGYTRTRARNFRERSASSGIVASDRTRGNCSIFRMVAVSLGALAREWDDLEPALLERLLLEPIELRRHWRKAL